MNALTTTTTGAELVTVAAQPPDQNPAFVYLAGLSAGGRRTMRQALYAIGCIINHADPGEASEAEQNGLIAGLPWGALRFQHTALIRSELLARYSPATANKMLSALRGTLKAAWRLGQLEAEEYQRAIDLKRVAGGGEDPRGRALARGEIRAIFNACAKDDSAAGLRDAAMFALLYGAGLRRAELAALERADFTPDGDDNWTLTVQHGKGNKRRLIPVNDGALDALRDWLSVRGDAPGPLFVPVNKGGRLALGQQMTSQAVYNMLAKRGAAAGVADFSPHDLRRTFISDLLDEGADIATVQHLAGHANVTTTARYDRRGERAKRKAVGLLHVPYKARRLPEG